MKQGPGQAKLWHLGTHVKTLALWYIKTCYKALETGRVKCGHKDRQREIWDRLEKPETCPHVSGDQIYDKGVDDGFFDKWLEEN